MLFLLGIVIPHIGYLVITGIYVGRSIGRALRVRNYQTYLGDFFIFIGTWIWTSYLDIIQRNKPPSRNRGRAMKHIHHTRDKRSGNGRTRTFDRHLINIKRRIISSAIIGKPSLNIIANKNRVKHDVLLHKATEDVHLFVFLQFITTSLAYNLHIDTIAFEENVLILRNIGGLTLSLELRLTNDLNALTRNKPIDGIAFSLLLVGIGLIILTTGV